jgi:methylglutaconyl-CoA hydratase
MFHKVLFEVAGAVARITLNRPDKRNALDPEMAAELGRAMGQAAEDGAVRVITLAGAGKDFCSGADLESVARAAESGVLENLADARSLANIFLAIRRAAKPVVALVRGRALAGGCGLATACDIVLAAESAQFGYPEVNIGFVPAMVMAILRRAVSERAAFELAVGGSVINAWRARELGLAHHVYADNQFDELAGEYVRELAAKPATAVALTKQLLYRTDALPFEAALEAGVEVNAISRMTADFRQGVNKFLKKT